jgi:hypothetical protein
MSIANRRRLQRECRQCLCEHEQKECRNVEQWYCSNGRQKIVTRSAEAAVSYVKHGTKKSTYKVENSRYMKHGRGRRVEFTRNAGGNIWRKKSSRVWRQQFY